MVGGFDLDENREPEPERIRIDQHYALGDDAALGQLLDPPPAGRLRQVHAIRDLAHGQGCVVLQDCEDLPIDGVHLSPSLKLEHYSTIAQVQCNIGFFFAPTVDRLAFTL